MRIGKYRSILSRLDRSLPGEAPIIKEVNMGLRVKPEDEEVMDMKA